MKITYVKICVGLLSTVIFLIGCSPAQEKGQEAIQQMLDLDGNGLIKLDNFEKTDGQQGTMQNSEGITVKSYSMQYNAEVTAVKICLLEADKNKSFYAWGEGGPMMDIETDLPFGQWKLEDDGSQIFKLNPGQRCVIQGTIIFEKTDNGWQDESASVDSIGISP